MEVALCKWKDPGASAGEGQGCGEEAGNLPRFIYSQQQHTGPTGSLNPGSGNSSWQKFTNQVNSGTTESALEGQLSPHCEAKSVHSSK